MPVRLRFLLYFAGNLFHIDFGYILGRDPKPLPPPMKLSKEMVSNCVQHCIWRIVGFLVVNKLCSHKLEQFVDSLQQA